MTKIIPIKTTKTQQVIDWVTEKIHWQVYKPQDKIPSIRETAKLLGVSPFTVTQAFETLAIRGIIESVQGSGYYVSSGTDIQTLNEADTQQILAHEPANVLDTSWLMGHLFHNLPPERSSGSGLMPDDWLYPRQYMQQASKKTTSNLGFVYSYGHIQGYLPLREQFAVQLAESGIKANAMQMMTTAGVSAGIELVVRALCQAGDTVLVDDPTWFWIIGCLQQMGMKIVAIDRTLAGIDFAQLETVLTTHRPKLYITNSILHKPTSANVTPKEVFEVLKLMEKYDCYIVEDDVYRNFLQEKNLQEKNALRYATLDGFSRVFYISGVAKVLGGNWRVGIVCSPMEHLPALLRQKMLTNMTCPEITERTVLHIWQSPHYKKYLSQVNDRLRHAHQQLKQKLAKIGLVYPPDTNINLFIWQGKQY